MNASHKFSIAPDVLAQEVGDELVLLDLKSGTYFGLDPIGSHIWRLIGEGRRLGEICETLLGEYDVSSADLERDAARLTDELVTRRLLVLEE